MCPRRCAVPRALVAVLMFWQGVTAKPKKNAGPAPHRDCPEPYVMDAQGICIMTHAMPPIRVCPNGVLRDDMCFVMALPDATPCPGGFIEELVDGDKQCVATRAARLRMACYGPHEKLENDLCIERIAWPLVLECLKGTLNHEQQCEIIIAQPPKPVCNPGFFDLRGMCVRRREAPCDLLPDKLSSSWHRGKDDIGSGKVMDLVSMPIPMAEERKGHFIPPRVGKKGNDVVGHEVIGKKHELEGGDPLWATPYQTDNQSFVLAETPAHEAMDESSYGNTVGVPSPQPAYSGTLQDDFDHVAAEGKSVPLLHSDDTKLELDQPWHVATTSAVFGLDDGFLDLGTTVAVTRRLQGTKHASEQSSSIGSGTLPSALPDPQHSQQQNGEAPYEGFDADDTEEAESSPRLAPVTVAFIPAQASLYLTGHVVPVPQHKPLILPSKPVLVPLLHGGRNPLRPYGHDNRLGYAMTAGGPWLRESVSNNPLDGSLVPNDLQATPFKMAPHDGKPAGFYSQDGGVQSSARNSVQPTRHGSSENPDVLHSQTSSENGESANSSGGRTKPGDKQRRRLQSGRRFLYGGFNESAGTNTKGQGGTTQGLEGRQGYDAGGPADRLQQDINLQTAKERRKHGIRGLQALDHIPGCWEEEFEMPLGWTCDEGSTLDEEQHVCIRFETTSPNVLCDGQVEGDLCVHVTQKPPQWYCPLDPPPPLPVIDEPASEKKHKPKDPSKPDSGDKSKSKNKTQDQQKSAPGQETKEEMKKIKGEQEDSSRRRPGGQLSGDETPAAGGSSELQPNRNRPGSTQEQSQGSVDRTRTDRTRADRPGREGAASATAQQASARRDPPSGASAVGADGTTREGEEEEAPTDRQQAHPRRPTPQRRNASQERNIESEKQDDHGDEQDEQRPKSPPMARIEENRQRTTPKQRQSPENFPAEKPQKPTPSNERDEPEERDGSRDAQPQQDRPQQTVWSRPKAQSEGEREEVPEYRQGLREEGSEETVTDDADDDETRTGVINRKPRTPGLPDDGRKNTSDSAGKSRTSQANNNLGRRWRPPQPQSQPQPQQNRPGEVKKANDRGERSDNLTYNFQKVEDASKHDALRRPQPHRVRTSMAESQSREVDDGDTPNRGGIISTAQGQQRRNPQPRKRPKPAASTDAEDSSDRYYEKPRRNGASSSSHGEEPRRAPHTGQESLREEGRSRGNELRENSEGDPSSRDDDDQDSSTGRSSKGRSRRLNAQPQTNRQLMQPQHAGEVSGNSRLSGQSKGISETGASHVLAAHSAGQYSQKRERVLAEAKLMGHWVPSQAHRRLNHTHLPYAYFIMAVNQWRHIHDPVHQLRMEASAAHAADLAARKGLLPVDPPGPFGTHGGYFGTPTRMGPQVYRHDIKDPKKPKTSPLKVRETELCYRQERRRPLVVCPPGFTPNKEGGCYMILAPAFTCLEGYFYENGQCVQHRELELTGEESNKHAGKGKKS